jgi:hypothetical protein
VHLACGWLGLTTFSVFHHSGRDCPGKVAPPEWSTVLADGGGRQASRCRLTLQYECSYRVQSFRRWLLYSPSGCHNAGAPTHRTRKQRSVGGVSGSHPTELLARETTGRCVHSGPRLELAQQRGRGWDGCEVRVCLTADLCISPSDTRSQGSWPFARPAHSVLLSETWHWLMFVS